MGFVSRNPYTGQEIERFHFDERQVLDELIDKAHDAFLNWSAQTFAARSACFVRLAQLLRERKDELAVLITEEMGKVIRESKAELEKSALTADYYAAEAEAMLRTEHYASSGQQAEVVYQPMGLIYGIFPWNFPFWQVLRFAIPTMMAGNTAIFKHAENVPRCALAIEKLFVDAGFPKHAISNVFNRIDDVEHIIAHPKVRAVTLTGSERAGRSVAALAGKHLKKVVLELGGSDPFIVLPGADIQAAARIGVMSRYQNTGQSCIAAKRFIIHEKVYREFTSAFESEIRKLKVGDPLKEDTTLGVIARPDLCEQLEQQVKESIDQGAVAELGGKRTGPVTFEPGILSGVKKGMPAYHEELFGPVASFFNAATADECISIANDTNFGLSAAIWGEAEEIHKVALQIQSGMVYLNTMSRSTPELPFGGTKNSGIGRELSPLGIKEFTNPKTIFPLP